jgi:2-keto-4-pentenoate hydratase/2-oxohepta-3-ene-1,7-dioic acid hydratase in catechol pathway
VRFVTYSTPSQPARVGALRDEVVCDVGFDGDMVAFIEAGAPVRREEPVADVTLLAPLRPRSLRDFLTFEGHLLNIGKLVGMSTAPEWYRVPAYYKGLPDTVIGPEAEIPWPSYAEVIDYELELAAVIGTPGRDISRERAEEHIFGWTIWNDVSARDTQRVEMPVGMGPGKAKDWDGSNVLGPCIVTSDELAGEDLRMLVRVNGKPRTEASSASMHWRFADLIEYSARDQTLRAGEVIGSGTAPGGSAYELGLSVREGDVVELEIEGIGVLRNTIGRRAAPRR